MGSIMKYIFIFCLLITGLTSWSQTIPPYTAPGAPIDAVEYFIDSDPGFGQGTALQLTNGQDIIIDTAIDVSQIAPGIHTLHVRARDANNNWSLLQSNIFWVDVETFFYQNNAPLSNITRIEYFLDVDPGLGNGIALNSVDGLDVFIDTALDVSSLAPGIHTLHVRARNETGAWSQIQSNIFWIDVESFFKVRQDADREIAKIEYFIDNDPGFSQGFSIPSNDTIDFMWTGEICVSSLDSGEHYIHARSQDNYQAWSLMQVDTFLLTKNVNPQIFIDDRFIYLDSVGEFVFDDLASLVDSSVDFCAFDTAWIDMEVFNCAHYKDTLLVNLQGVDIHGAFVMDSFRVIVQDTFDYCCPVNRVMTAPIIESGIYRASVSITATGTIRDSSNVIFQAGEYIDLMDSFNVQAGSDFETIIANPCPD